MSENDGRADTPPLNWSELGVNELLPTGTVTLLLADAAIRETKPARDRGETPCTSTSDRAREMHQYHSEVGSMAIGV